MSLVQLRSGLAAYAGSECGASAAEYALLLVILAGCGVVTLHHLGANINSVYAKVAGTLGAH